MNHVRDPNLLIHDSLLRTACPQWVKKAIPSMEDPLGFCIAHDFVKRRNFYTNLASVLSCEYADTLPQRINPTLSIVQYVPSDLLFEYLLYPFECDGVLYIALANPFLDRDVIEELVRYLPYEQYTLVISHPNAIRDVLAQSLYAHQITDAENRVDVLRSRMSTRTYSTLIVPHVFPIATLIALVGIGIVAPAPTIIALFVFLNVYYLISNIYKFTVSYFAARGGQRFSVSDAEVAVIDEVSLPMYTVLAPMKDEAVMVPQLVASLFALDYPKHRLDIKFVVEADDLSTIDALKAEGVGVVNADTSPEVLAAQLVIVPVGKISTKPRSLNYALIAARGRYTVIYDAEDRPDADQLKKAVRGYEKSSINTACIQAQLNFYNTDHNIITRLFTLEYSYWFDYFLPGLDAVSSPIPLGGTSNHFVTKWLRQVGGWDPLNVTEDADLGLRFSREGLRVAVVNSKTYEEANSQIYNWIIQRTRWQKGFLLTFLVHTSHPFRLMQTLGLRKSIQALLVFGGNFFLPLFNPVLWVLFALSFSPYMVDLGLGGVMGAIALFNLIAGNLFYITIHIIAALHIRRPDLLLVVPLLPLYWMLLSYATYRALIQFMRKPYHWEKTKHGLTS